MLFRRVCAALVSASAVIVMIPAGGAAASTGPVSASRGMAGYAVTGAHFDTAETWVRLSDASRFSREIGRLGMSVQLWTSTSVIDLKVTACTDVSCLPGGRKAVRNYRLQLAVYRRSTGALVCSTSAAGSRKCPGVPRSWTRARIAPGRQAAIALAYRPPYDFVFATVNNREYNYPVSTHSVFGQARIGVEFGTSPWAAAPFRAPRVAMPVASFDRPAPPPYAAEIGTMNGSAGGIASWWAHRQVRMTGGPSGRRVEARPGRLWDQGYGFTVSLEP